MYVYCFTMCFIVKKIVMRLHKVEVIYYNVILIILFYFYITFNIDYNSNSEPFIISTYIKKNIKKKKKKYIK